MRTSIIAALCCTIITACAPDSPSKPEQKPVQETAGADGHSVTVNINCNLSSSSTGIKHLDIFVYSGNPLLRLVKHIRMDLEECRSSLLPVELELDSGDYIIAAIADCRYQFDASKLAAYETLESLCLQYADEDPQHPVRSGTAQASVVSGRTEVMLELEPLLCEIQVRSIDWNPGYGNGDIRLEHPRVYLLNANSQAEPMRKRNFRATQMLNCGSLSPADVHTLLHPEMLYRVLESDVGRYTSYPQASLFCYPNDPEKEDIGCPRTILVLEAEVFGRTLRREIEMPALRRGSLTPVDLSISADTDLQT